jgi:peptidoglycan/LPS O-acetylase OafA/YrhL
MRRIPTLDGWRGIAILFVIANHAAIYSRYHDRFWAAQGSTGVDIFFVISGYIITSRLLKEAGEDGRFSLPAFYGRRALRILPLVTSYLVVVAALTMASRAEIFGSLFFFRNYQMAAGAEGVYTAHLWSLSIEEHFYLLWPVALFCLGSRRALWAALSGAIACALWRTHDYGGTWVSALFRATEAAPYFHVIRTDTRVDGLLLGCAAALLLEKDRVRTFIHSNFPKETPILAGFPLFLVLQHSRGLPSLTEYILITVALVSTLVVDDGLARRWLNYPPLVWIGRVSFGLYIWQELFLMHSETRIASLVQRFPFNIAASFGAAALSYYLIEKPLLRAFQSPAAPQMEHSKASDPGRRESDLPRLSDRSWTHTWLRLKSTLPVSLQRTRVAPAASEQMVVGLFEPEDSLRG